MLLFNCRTVQNEKPARSGGLLQVPKRPITSDQQVALLALQPERCVFSAALQRRGFLSVNLNDNCGRLNPVLVALT